MREVLAGFLLLFGLVLFDAAMSCVEAQPAPVWRAVIIAPPNVMIPLDPSNAWEDLNKKECDALVKDLRVAPPAQILCIQKVVNRELS